MEAVHIKGIADSKSPMLNSQSSTNLISNMCCASFKPMKSDLICLALSPTTHTRHQLISGCGLIQNSGLQPECHRALKEDRSCQSCPQAERNCTFLHSITTRGDQGIVYRRGIRCWTEPVGRWGVQRAMAHTSCPECSGLNRHFQWKKEL